MHTVTVRKVTIGEGIPKICVPIVAPLQTEILKEAEQICKMQADLVEWRADWFAQDDPHAAVQVLAALRGVLGDMPLLFTFRTKNEGGQKQIGIKEYAALNEAAARSGYADLIDVELSAGDDAVKSLIAAAHECGVHVIASSHDFEKTPKQQEIVQRLCEMQRLGADILKIAVMPKSRADVLTLLAATEQMQSYANRPVVTMSMGGFGAVSRICGEVFGSAMTFGAAQKASAPGQLAVQELAAALSMMHHSLL